MTHFSSFPVFVFVVFFFLFSFVFWRNVVVNYYLWPGSQEVEVSDSIHPEGFPSPANKEIIKIVFKKVMGEGFEREGNQVCGC